MRTRGYVRPPRRPRRLSTVAALVVIGAALTAAAAALTWSDGTGVDDLRGVLDLGATGGRVAPALVPLAVAALAALGATLAAKGPVRRVVGALTMLLGVAVCWLGVRGLLVEPDVSVFTSSTGVTLTDVHIRPFGPSLAVLGGLAMLSAGFSVVTGRIRARGLGARYERSTVPSTPAVTSADVELGMWKELDAHRDPTLDQPSSDGRDRLDRAADDATRRGESSA